VKLHFVDPARPNFDPKNEPDNYLGPNESREIDRNSDMPSEYNAKLVRLSPKTEEWTGDFADSTDYEEVMILDFCQKK